jgi:CDGSH-type Zn-finger protein
MLEEDVMLLTLDEVIVYVTRVLRSLRVQNVKLGNCLCKCYTSSSKPSCCKYWMR